MIDNEKRIINRTVNVSIDFYHLFQEIVAGFSYTIMSREKSAVFAWLEQSFILIVSDEISVSFPISIAFQTGTFKRVIILNLVFHSSREIRWRMWKECIRRLIVHKTLDVHIPNQCWSSWCKHARDFARYRRAIVKSESGANWMSRGPITSFCNFRFVIYPEVCCLLQTWSY